jgi:hypothetical protein
VHRRADDAPQVINLSEDDKKAALKAFKEVEYENRQTGTKPVTIPRSPRRRPASLPDDQASGDKPTVMGVPAQARVIEEGDTARKAMK